MSEVQQDRYLWGLDLSLKNTGIAIYNLDAEEFVHTGSFSTERIYATRDYRGLNIHGLKLRKILEWLEELMKEYPPSLVSIERGFSRFNNETQALFRVFGVAQCLLWDTPQTLYPPNSVKASIVHGNATKEDVSNAIISNPKFSYLEDMLEDEDQSDAVAVAITYLIEKELVFWHKPTWASVKRMREPKK